ncbi:MAG: hypothetical protein CUN56_13165 [Phototrophicales bacterium]|nr:MAG: hypothetical protein CUN56_13165 [Phototrophicales bacterium]RMG71132.1 MAG: hypothetical protein D6711_16045 [Chloroflexota bacterium]
MTSFKLQTNQATAYFDPQTQVAHIRYNGVLSADVTIEVYRWLDQLYQQVGTQNINGQIFDFRDVQAFSEDNLQIARKTSNRMNMKVDNSHIPVALIVANHEQEEILRGPMRIPAEHVRKRIVWSDEEARQFLVEWKQKHG